MSCTRFWPKNIMARFEAPALRPAQLGVPGFTRKAINPHPDLADGTFPFIIESRVEKESFIGRREQPAICLDLGVELTRPPSGIAKRQKALSWSAAASNVSQDIQACRQADVRALPLPRPARPTRVSIPAIPAVLRRPPRQARRTCQARTYGWR